MVKISCQPGSSLFSDIWVSVSAQLSNFATPWTVACQAPLSMKFSRQEYFSIVISCSRGSSWPRDWTRVSYVSWISRQILCNRATWEAPLRYLVKYYSRYFCKVFLDEISIYISRYWVEKITLRNMSGPHQISWNT